MTTIPKFYKQISDDLNLANELRIVLESNGIAMSTPFSDFSDEAIRAMVAVAKNIGYDFTAGQVKVYFAKARANELPDDELRAVTCGLDNVCENYKLKSVL